MAISAKSEDGDPVGRLLGGVQLAWGRALGAGDRSAIHGLMRGMSRDDLALRFGAALSADRLALYVEAIDFERNVVWALGKSSGEAFALLELMPFADRGCSCAEVAFMVAPAARGRGIGSLLMEKAIELARERGIQRLVAQACPGNAAALAILRAAGMRLVAADGDVLGALELPTAAAAGKASAVAADATRLATAGRAAAITG